LRHGQSNNPFSSVSTFHRTATLPFVIPSAPGFPTSLISPATTYVVLLKENHMQPTEAATLDRKSGEAEGSAVPRTFRGSVESPLQTRLSSRPEPKGEKHASVQQPLSMEPSPFPLSSREPVTFSIFSCFAHPISCISSPRQSRHPERSASLIYRKQRALWRGVEGPRRCLLADALGSFPAANYTEKIKKSQTPSEAEGSAVPRTFPGSVESRRQTVRHEYGAPK
jgi:hypothetical protein